jgi:hypothetical protein
MEAQANANAATEVDISTVSSDDWWARNMVTTCFSSAIRRLRKSAPRAAIRKIRQAGSPFLTRAFRWNDVLEIRSCKSVRGETIR